MAGSGTERRDSGFTLVEVVVAFALFAVMATALLVVVTTTQRVTREDAARVVANNLASRELEITRDAFSGITRGPARVATNRVVNQNPLPGGVAGQALVVDDVAYTVVRDAQWAAVGSSASTCDDGSSAELAYLKVEVQVSWPELGDRPPVTMDTIMTPSKGTYSATTGHIGLRVLDRAGQPRPGVRVTATPVAGGQSSSAATASDGCVLFSFLAPGDYLLGLASAGEVDPSGSPTATRTVRVQAGQLWRGTQEYDRAATISATLTAAPEHALPVEVGKIPLSIGNSALLPRGSRAIEGGGETRVLTNLWPYLSGYQLWAGGCADSDPGDAKAAAEPAEPGETTAATVVLPAVDVTTPGAGQQVVASHPADSVCPVDVTFKLGTSNGTTLRTSLPYGTWTLRRPGVAGSSTVTISVPPTDQSSDTPTSAPITQVSVP